MGFGLGWSWSLNGRKRQAGRNPAQKGGETHGAGHRRANQRREPRQLAGAGEMDGSGTVHPQRRRRRNLDAPHARRPLVRAESRRGTAPAPRHLHHPGGFPHHRRPWAQSRAHSHTIFHLRRLARTSGLHRIPRPRVPLGAGDGTEDHDRPAYRARLTEWFRQRRSDGRVQMGAESGLGGIRAECAGTIGPPIS